MSVTLAANALTTVERVKEQGSGIDSTDPTQDENIRYLINSVSQRMIDEGREYKSLAVGSTARKFAMNDRDSCYWSTVDFGRYDAQTVTAVTVDTQLGQTGSTLTTSQYQLLPVGAHDGVYTQVRVFSVPAGGAPYGVQREATVTGTWGWPTVPQDIEHACTAQVIAWLLRFFQVNRGLDDTIQIVANTSLDYSTRAALENDRKIQIV